jgi:glutathione S-transferase
MSELILHIGDKNISSWSLRPWLALRATGAPMREVEIQLDRPDTRESILRVSPSGRVPVLHDGDVVVWESLAICEYLAERFPAAGLWPDDAAARATARAVSCEMHSGFAALRGELSMDIRARIERTPSAAALADIARITSIWRECRRRHGDGGEFLFGRFGIADCMFAPVATRFRTYGVGVDEVSQRWCDAIVSWPAMREWIAAAERE